MARVMVTGAGGYMGNVLVGQLLQENFDVVALDRYFFGEDILDPYRDKPGLSVLKKDIRDLDVADFSGIDAVFDLAAFSNDPSGELDPELTRAINYRGRAHVSATAKQAGVKRYLLASSCSVYGAAGEIPCTEKDPINPLTVYAECNALAEKAAFEQMGDGFCVTALRFSTLFGLSRRMRFDLVINYMSLIAVTKRRVEIMGGGQQWRPLVHVRDAVRAFRTALAAPVATVNGQVFNIGYTNAQIWQLAEVVKKKLLFDVEIVIIPGTADKRDYKVDFAKAKEVLDYTAQVDEIRGFDEVTAALLEGRVAPSTKTFTVDWYKHLLEAKNLYENISLNGRYLR
jgi:nucleoside-diphosphate-sugar epimerase